MANFRKLVDEFSWPVYCRSCLVTFGVLVGGFCGFLWFAATLEPRGILALSHGWLFGLGIASLIAVILVIFGIAGSTKGIERLANFLPNHEIVFLIMLLAVPLYFVLAPFYRDR